MSGFQTSSLIDIMPVGMRANSVPNALRRGSTHSSTSAPVGRRQSAFEALGLRRKSDIEIVLEDEAETVHSYTTHDEIKGSIVVKFEKDTAIDDLVVTFEGTTFTYVEKIATAAPTTGRTTGRHTFLKLVQPIDIDYLPENRIAKAGATYSVPFHFVVPDRLLPYVCSHKTNNEVIKKAHLQLPPSLGDLVLNGDGQNLLDDLAPDMSKINYNIRARLARRSPAGRQTDIIDKARPVRIIPAREEEPTFYLEDDNQDFNLRKEKNVRKGLFKIGKKTGRLTAETVQPTSFRLPPPNKRTQEPVSIVTTVNLRFDPQTVDDKPPQLGSIVSKLRAYTFFGAAPFKLIPGPKDMDTWSTLHGMYPDTVELSTRSLSSASWTRHEPKTDTPPAPIDVARRPSTFSADSTRSIPEPSASYPGSHFYTASLVIPLALPKHKAFVPSFHSCIVSRTYTLELSLSYSTPGANVGSSTINLKVPVQISSEGAHPHTLEAEEAIAREIERQFFSGTDANSDAGLEPASPEYELRDTAAPGYTEGPMAMRRASLANEAAPPEYHSGLGRMPLRGSGAPRTQSEMNFMWPRRPSLGFARRANAVLALNA